MILLKELHIKNFRSHSDSRVEFDTGINLIAGRNGAGKSSILEAILVALYGLRAVNLKKSELVRINSSGYSIRLSLQLNEKDITISRNSDGESVLTANEIIEGENSITDWVEKHICPVHTFTGAIYVRQGEIDSIIRDEEGRERIIRKITRIEDYENAWKNLGTIIRMLELERDNLLNFLSQEGQLRIKMEEKRRELQKISGEISELEKKEKGIEEEVNLLCNRLEKLESIRKNLENLRNRESAILQEIKGLEAKMESLKRQIDEATKRIEDLKLLVDEFERLKPKAERYIALDKLRSEIERLIKEIDELERKLKEELLKIETKIKKAEDDREELEKIKTEMESLKEKVEELEKYNRMWEDARVKFERLQDLRAKVEEKDLSYEMVEKLYSAILKAKEEEKKLSEKFEILISKRASLKTKAKQLKQAVEGLRAASGTCPVCGRELDEEHKKRVIAEYLEEMKRISDEIKKADEVESVLKEKKMKIEKTLSKQEAVLKLREIVKEAKSLENELSKHDIEMLKSKSEDYQKAKETFERLKGQEKILFSSVKQLEELRRQKEEIERKIEAEELKRQKILERLREEGFENLESLEKEIENLKEHYGRWLQLRDCESRLDDERRRLSGLKEDTAAVEEKLMVEKENLEAVQSEIKKILDVYSEEEYKRIGREHLRKSEELSAIRSKLGVLRESLKGLEEDIDYLSNQLIQMEEYRRKVEVIERKAIPELAEIREKFRRYRNLVAEAAMKDVENYASEIFEELTDGKYSGIRLKKVTERGKERLRIFVVYQGEERDVGFLSGGEMIALGLAFRLALSMFMIKGRIPLLILDEPTPFLDEERRRKLVDIMTNYLKKIPQVIIVSHDDELKDAADRVIFVDYQGGASRVGYVETQ